MGTPLCCRLGYHKFGPWEEVRINNPRTNSGFTPRAYIHRKRVCKRCHLEHIDYSPQIGVLVTPPAGK